MLLRAFGVRVVVRLKEHNVSQLPVVDGIVPVVSPNTNLETLTALFNSRTAVVITLGGQPQGILTKIDILDYLSSQVR